MPLGSTVSSLVPDDELVGHIIQVIADDLRLRTNIQQVVTDALDQRRLPTGGHCTKRVPGMAGNQAKLRWVDAEFPSDVSIRLGGRFVLLDAVYAEASFEKPGDAAVIKLLRLNLDQIVCQSEQSKSCVA